MMVLAGHERGDGLEGDHREDAGVTPRPGVVCSRGSLDLQVWILFQPKNTRTKLMQFPFSCCELVEVNEKKQNVS